MPAAASLTLPPVSLIEISIALLLGTFLSALTALQYVKFGRTFTNRSNLAYTLPIVTLAVILIITIVKSSIALSLGLVGSLSIVRFRTPIREPEELGYLFIVIAIGIGLGANQTVATVASTLFILGVATVRKAIWGRPNQRNLYLNLDVAGADTPGEQVFQQALEVLGANVSSADLRRLDVADGTMQAAVYISVADDAALARAIGALRERLPGKVTVTFIDQESTGVAW